jgi:hypothetical protein
MRWIALPCAIRTAVFLRGLYQLGAEKGPGAAATRAPRAGGSRHLRPGSHFRARLLSNPARVARAASQVIVLLTTLDKLLTAPEFV